MNEAFLTNRLFEGLTPEVLRSVGIQEVEYQPGDLIFDEGTAGSTLMLVGRGRVQISKTGRQGLQETLATFEKNDFFGELAVIDRGPRSGRVLRHTSGRPAGPARRQPGSRPRTVGTGED